MSKIGFVCDTLPFCHSSYSGAEISCEHVASKHVDEGHDVFFITSKKDSQTDKKVYELPKSHSKNFPVDLHIIYKLHSILKKENPDRIHLFTKKYLWPSVIAANWRKIPITYSVVDYHIMCRHNILKRKDGTLCNDRKGWYCKFRQIFFNWIIKKISCFWTFTETSKNRMVVWGIPANKIKVIYQYEVPSVQDKKDLPYPTIVFVGSIHPHKGVDVVVKSMKNIVDVFPNANLLLVGHIDHSRYSDKIFAFVRENDLAKNVEFLGKFAHASALRLMNGADVIVVAEQWYSDFGPLTLYEAKKLNVPVVSGNLGASKEFTTNIVRYNDPDEYSKKILELLKEGKIK